MKITVILGSPRPQGFGSRIEKSLLGLLGESGRQAKTYELNSLTYRGCQACMSCKTGAEVCVQKDDLAPILEDVRAADVTIFSAPIYMGEVCAQAKGLLDRIYSYLNPDFRTNPKSGRLAPGKKMVFIMTQGHPDEAMYSAVLARHRRTFDMCGFTDVLPIQICGARPGSEAEAGKKAAARLADVAKALLAPRPRTGERP
jgi:multimeric flavodoxin WrbA